MYFFFFYFIFCFLFSSVFCSLHFASHITKSQLQLWLGARTVLEVVPVTACFWVFADNDWRGCKKHQST